ncbi:hypothetical protein CDD81_6644 [Ophiocordyceps australis]|uniref:Uncharacterized protein n=1 Tax=Ophiocordyceps australis TaxID=1399860 RepID=A0A2C5Y7B8_9HYPO|nr:hypothetical protein CDD81_6644 [Ophiocordyceps australis]
MKFSSTLVLACAGSAFCRPAVPSSDEIKSSIETEAKHSGALVPQSDLTQLIDQFQSMMKQNELEIAPLVKKATQFVNDFAAEESHSKRASDSPMHASVNTLRARIDSGDVDFNKAAKDGLAKLRAAANEQDLNSLVGEAMTLLENKLNEQDLNNVVMTKLKRSIEEEPSLSIGNLVKRGIMDTITSTIMSNLSWSNISKIAMRMVMQMANQVDFNVLARKAINMATSAIANMDLNKTAKRSADSLEDMISGTDLNALATRGLDVLMG